jgi:hypothetical protein
LRSLEVNRFSKAAEGMRCSGLAIFSHIQISATPPSRMRLNHPLDFHLATCANSVILVHECSWRSVLRRPMSRGLPRFCGIRETDGWWRSRCIAAWLHRNCVGKFSRQGRSEEIMKPVQIGKLVVWESTVGYILTSSRGFRTESVGIGGMT